MRFVPQMALIAVLGLVLAAGCKDTSQPPTGADKGSPSVTQTTNFGEVTHVAYWTCPMHPEVKADKPGKCPKCGMTLVPVPETGPKLPTELPPASDK